MTIRESKRADWLSHCGLTDAVTARSLPVTAAYINYCFITGHILRAFISSINHSSILISWFICAIFQTWIINKLSRGTSSAACWWMGNSVDRKPVFSTPSSGVSVQRAFPIFGPFRKRMSRTLHDCFKLFFLQNPYSYPNFLILYTKQSICSSLLDLFCSKASRVVDVPALIS